MDTELRAYLDARFQQIAGTLQSGHETLGNEVRGEIEALRKETRTDIATLHNDFEILRTELRKDLEKTETNLLSAFYSWARPMEIRQRGVSAVVAGFDERLSLDEERISALERRTRNLQ